MRDRFGIRPLRHQLAVEHRLVELLVDPARAGRFAVASAVDALVNWAQSGSTYAKVDAIDTAPAEFVGLPTFEILA